MQGVEGATNRPKRRNGGQMTNRIAFQGALGAYSHEACKAARSRLEPLPCSTFEDMIEAVVNGRADNAMVPVENSTYGRVADIHRLLPGSGLHIIDEVFTRVRICLIANSGTKLKDIKSVRAHVVLLPQARKFLDQHQIEPIHAADSAGAAAELALHPDPTSGVLASSIAAKNYSLKILAKGIENNSHNTTRFLIMSRSPDFSRRGKGKMITTFVFQVRNIPASLYKAMGGFATNGVNMLKLESYMLGGSFTATQFYADIEGHPQDKNVKLALEELEYFSTSIKILGVYPSAPHRSKF